MRVVHLLDPACCGDEGVLACAQALSIPGAQQSVWLVGDSAAEKRAWSLGIESTDRVTPRRDWMGRPSVLAAEDQVRALAGARFTADGGEPDIVCCWSVGMLALARKAIGKRRPWRVGVLVRPPIADVDEGRERAIAEYGLHDATVVALHEGIADAYARAASVRRGGTLLRDNIRVAEPPAFVTGGAGGGVAFDREAIRAAMGIEPGDRVVGLLADPPRAADATRMIFNVGLAFTMGERLIALAPRGINHARRAARFVRAHGRQWGLCLTDASLPEIIAASDVCSIDAAPRAGGGIVPSCGQTGAALCAAMGVPVVAYPASVAGWNGNHSPPVVLAIDNDRNKLTVSALQMLEHGRARNEAAAAQRVWRERARARDNFRSTLAAVFRELANVPERREGLPMPTALVGAGA